MDIEIKKEIEEKIIDYDMERDDMEVDEKPYYLYNGYDYIYNFPLRNYLYNLDVLAEKYDEKEEDERDYYLEFIKALEEAEEKKRICEERKREHEEKLLDLGRKRIMAPFNFKECEEILDEYDSENDEYDSEKDEYDSENDECDDSLDVKCIEKKRREEVRGGKKIIKKKLKKITNIKQKKYIRGGNLTNTKKIENFLKYQYIIDNRHDFGKFSELKPFLLDLKDLKDDGEKNKVNDLLKIKNENEMLYTYIKEEKDIINNITYINKEGKKVDTLVGEFSPHNSFSKIEDYIKNKLNDDKPKFITDGNLNSGKIEDIYEPYKNTLNEYKGYIKNNKIFTIDDQIDSISVGKDIAEQKYKTYKEEHINLLGFILNLQTIYNSSDDFNLHKIINEKIYKHDLFEFAYYKDTSNNLSTAFIFKQTVCIEPLIHIDSINETILIILEKVADNNYYRQITTPTTTSIYAFNLFELHKIPFNSINNINYQIKYIYSIKDYTKKPKDNISTDSTIYTKINKDTLEKLIIDEKQKKNDEESDKQPGLPSNIEYLVILLQYFMKFFISEGNKICDILKNIKNILFDFKKIGDMGKILFAYFFNKINVDSVFYNHYKDVAKDYNKDSNNILDKFYNTLTNTGDKIIEGNLSHLNYTSNDKLATLSSLLRNNNSVVFGDIPTSAICIYCHYNSKAFDLKTIIQWFYEFINPLYIDIDNSTTPKKSIFNDLETDSKIIITSPTGDYNNIYEKKFKEKIISILKNIKTKLCEKLLNNVGNYVDFLLKEISDTSEKEIIKEKYVYIFKKIFEEFKIKFGSFIDLYIEEINDGSKLGNNISSLRNVLGEISSITRIIENNLFLDKDNNFKFAIIINKIQENINNLEIKKKDSSGMQQLNQNNKKILSNIFSSLLTIINTINDDTKKKELIEKNKSFNKLLIINYPNIFNIINILSELDEMENTFNMCIKKIGIDIIGTNNFKTIILKLLKYFIFYKNIDKLENEDEDITRYRDEFKILMNEEKKINDAKIYEQIIILNDSNMRAVRQTEAKIKKNIHETNNKIIDTMRAVFEIKTYNIISTTDIYIKSSLDNLQTKFKEISEYFGIELKLQPSPPVAIPSPLYGMTPGGSKKNKKKKVLKKH